MRKYILIIAAIPICLASFGQQIRSLSGFDPITGRPGYIWRDTSIVSPFSTLKYLTGYNTWGNFSDTTRSLFSAVSPLSYNSSTGAFSLGTVPIANGGTNITTYTTGDILYASATNVLSKLAAGSNGNVLTLASGVPSWAAASSGGGLADSTYFWSLTGNAPAYGKVFGTTISRSLRIVTNNIQRMMIDSVGKTFIDSIYNGRGNALGGYHTMNLAIGDSVLFRNSTGIRNIGIGDSVLRLNTTGSNNTGVGYNALIKNSTGSTSTALGVYALSENTTGDNNVGLGYGALRNNTTGAGNVAIGTTALYQSSAGQNVVAIGNNAMGEGVNTGQGNVGIGWNALKSNTSGQLQVGIGSETLTNNTTGTQNTGVGRRALYGNTTGTSNTGVGFSTSHDGTTGSNNTAIGESALFSNTTGSQNVMIGYRAGAYAVIGINNQAQQLNNSVIIGYQAGSGVDSTTNQIVIGHSTEGLGSNSTTIGNTSITNSQIMGAMKVATGTLSAAAASAQLEVTSTTKGFLPPRMTATQASAISSPAEGLLVYVTDTNGTFTAKGWWGYDGAAWQKLNN